MNATVALTLGAASREKSRIRGAPGHRSPMQKLLIMIVSSLVSAFGWAIGAPFGLMTAFMLSMVGLGVGIWLGQRLIARLLP